MAMLEVKDINVYYGMIHAIQGASFEVNQGDVVALIGANGAGKTTIMHSLCNLIPKKAGKVSFGGRDVTTVPAHKLVPMGVAQVPEGRRIFQELTVAENLRMGYYTRSDKKEMEETLESMYARFPILKERSKQIAGTLSGGEQQMLAMSRALMSHPKLLLLDEPSMGLSPLYVNTIFDMIKQVNKEGTTVLLVEQNAKKALSIADRAYVLETGSITLEGPADELLNNDSIRKAYLGE
jgi:branched-chain amino acid transport system ATP-binding protein